MAFDLYFAGTQKKEVMNFIRDTGCAKLYSFVDNKALINEYRLGETRGKLFIDSGAFSVAHRGEEISIDEYIKYINETDGIDIFAQLDVIPYPVLNHKTALASAEQSWKNYEYMINKVKPEKRQLVMPIFHFGEDIKFLRRILETEHFGELPSYIGVGGRHGVSTAKQRKYFKTIFNVIKSSRNSNVKVHAFGMTTLSILEEFPFTSADSTSWLKTAIYGGIITKDFGIVNVSEKSMSKKDNIQHAHDHLLDPFLAEIERKGFKLEDLQQNYADRLIFNVITMKEWADNYVCHYDIGPRERKLF